MMSEGMRESADVFVCRGRCVGRDGWVAWDDDKWKDKGLVYILFLDLGW